DMSSDEEYMRGVYNRALRLHIVGIVCGKEDSSSMALSNGVGYTRALTEYVIDEAERSSIVQKQLSDRQRDIFSGNSFDEENKKKENKLDFNDMISVNENMIKEAFQINIDEDDFDFDMPNEREMQKIVMESAQKAADMIEQVPDSRILAGMFALIDSQYVDSKVRSYESQEGIIETVEDEEGNSSSYLLLDDEKLSEVRSTITASDYRNFAKQIVQSIPETSGYAGLLEVFTDAQYGSLANDAGKMFDSYYDSVKTVSEEGKVAYHTDETAVSYGSGETPLNKNALLSGVIADPRNLSETSSVTNDVINNFVVSMIAAQIGNATAQMMAPMADSLSSLSEVFSGDIMTVDTDKFAKAFRFNMDEEELSRLMGTMMADTEEKSYRSNLISLGYQDMNDPTSISFYFRDFDGKENFLRFLDSYNEKVDEDTKIRYTDITGILMSSVKTIVDVVTYVLIAFVSISLVVSSIMIAVITLISVMERTKEIGILRAMGASKHNVSSIFSAETFIIGLLSGLLGVGVTAALIPLINTIIHNLTGNYDVNAVLPVPAAIALVIIAILLTIIAGFIPSKKAAKQDPVIALRTE
ncbi:MAG: ABC transporter permease, partial [Erysipelotrichaceae bacterium]|nr:ABC transporter permease [Erysipelotrichaceae bacterium]